MNGANVALRNLGILAFALIMLVVIGLPKAFAADAEPAGTTTPANASSGPATAIGHVGDVAAGIQKTIDRMNSLSGSLMTGAAKISERVKDDADKVAFGLGVIALTLAGLRWASTSDAVQAWTDFLEAILILGIFAALYVGYTDFAPAIFNWFNKIAADINTGDDVQSLVSTLISTAGKFFESIGNMLLSVLHSQTSLISAIGGAVLLFLAFIAVVAAALIYTWFLIVGKLMVAIGIALGSFAVAFGFLDITRKYFTAWLDYMITGSMYAVVAATVAQLASAPLLAAANDIGKIGTDTVLAAGYALTIAIVLVFVAMEVPKIAGSIFGTGGGISGTGGFKLLSRGAWNLGGKLAGKSKS